MLREPAVAGMFYDRHPESLKRSIELCFTGKLGPGKLPPAPEYPKRQIVALVCPHAGYIYSGQAAAWAYLALAEDGVPATAIILGPNHRGYGPPAAVAAEIAWRTPLGEVRIDRDLADAIVSRSTLIEQNSSPHLLEHSLEVQVPFLQYIKPNIRIVPIVVSLYYGNDVVACAENIGSAIADAVKDKNVVIIASTDFTHHEPKNVAAAQDAYAIDAIKRLDYHELLSVVEERDITMCGVVPTAITIVASISLGAKQGELLTYYTSGDVTGDTSEVVGYGALKITR